MKKNDFKKALSAPTRKILQRKVEKDMFESKHPLYEYYVQKKSWIV